MLIKKISLSLALVAGVSACAPEGNQTSLGSVPAGNDVLAGGFGYATAQNIQVMSISERLNYIKSLTRLFGAEAPATLNFAFNSSTLDETAKSQLRQQAAWIIAHPDITFRVYGHTDKVGSNGYNTRLGKRRANNAVRYLISQGVDKRKVDAVVSLGETRPLVFTETRNRENRRTVTEVMGFYNPESAGLLDGKVAVEIYSRYVGEGGETVVSSNE